jgi:hypothetical protein
MYQLNTVVSLLVLETVRASLETIEYVEQSNFGDGCCLDE